MKRVLSVCFVLFALLGLFALQAFAEEETPLWDYEECDGGIAVTAYNGTAEDVFVPGTIDGKQVVKLADGLFSDNDGLNSVTLGIGITEIGAKAFFDCDNLVCILISEELTTIGKEAFYSCDKLNSVILYDAVITIGANAFAQCPNVTVWCNESTAAYTYVTANSIAYEILNPNAEPEIVTLDGIEYYIMNGEAIAVGFDNSVTDVIIPSIVNGFPVTEIREAFSQSSVVSVDLPIGMRIISDKAFYMCRSLVEVNIPSSVREIGESAFQQCAITSVTIPDGITVLRKKVFYECTNLVEVQLPDSLKSLEYGVFSYCRSLVEISLPDGITEMGTGVFSDCIKLQKAKLPYGLVTVSYGTFYNCDSLVDVEIPESVQIIEYGVFFSCVALEKVVFPSSVKIIQDSVFLYCANLSEVVLPEGLERIATKAFGECPSLKQIVVPNSVTSLHKEAFYYSTVLRVQNGSYAHIFAQENDLMYFVEDGINEPEFYEVNEIEYYIIDGNAIAYRCNSTASQIEIPAYVGDYPVTELRYTFRKSKYLTSVSLPDTLRVIGAESFYMCTKLVSVNIPENVEILGLKAFAECKALKKLVLPDTVTTIGQAAIAYCNSLEDVNIPKSLTFIGENAFYGCLISEAHIPNGVSEIGESAFGACSNLSDVSLPSSITTIQSHLFYNCDALTKIAIPESVTTIENSAFYSCNNLISVIIPKSVTKMRTNSFDKGTLLLVYENSYGHTFAQNADWLYYVYDGTSEPEIYCIDGVYYYIVNEAAIAISYDGTVTDLVLPNCVGGYPVTSISDVFRGKELLTSIVLPDSLLALEGGTGGAFSFCTGLTSITIPGNVSYIGESAFSSCTNLQSVTICEGVTSIGEFAFSSCTNLQSVTMCEGVTSIGKYAFAYCNNLADIEFADSIETIWNSAFYYCENLKSIDLPKCLKVIHERAFEYCSLTTVIIPNGVTTINGSAFSCKTLEYVEIPESVISLSGFAGTPIKSIKLPDGLQEIGPGAFSSCVNLTEINIPDGVTSIGSNAFRSCTGLTELVLPSSIEIISDFAFQKCSNLKTVVICDGLKQIDRYAFEDCYNIRTIYLPETVELLGENAFANSNILLVHKDSYAHNFAIENNLLYFVITDTENPEIAYGAAISGTVTYTDGTAAVGAVVEILYDDGTVKESVTTDSAGAYAFTYAEVGRYTVRVTDAEGNTASTQVSVKRMNVFDVFLTGDTNLTLKKGWSVSGTVSETTATVTLTDEKGNILVSVDVTDGSFTLTNVPNGTYILKAETDTGTVSQEITVFNSDVSGISLTVAVESVTIWGYAEVEDRDQSRHRRGWVEVTVYNAEGTIAAQQKSKSDGLFRFEKLPVGQYSIVAQVSDMRPHREHGFKHSYTLTGYAYVDALTAGEYQTETIVLYEENDYKTAISGKVTARGEAQNCTVILRNAFRQEVAKCTTGNNGKYKFTNIRDGLYFVIASTESNGMGYTTVLVRNGRVYGDTDITVYKTDKISDREDRFCEDFNGCNDRETAQKHRQRIAEEKRFYDGLSEKEKKQLSKDYVERLNKMCEWIAECEYVTDQGVSVEQGGTVISGDELENGDAVSFELKVEKTDYWQASEDGVHTDKDYLYHDMHGKAGEGRIMQYYEISMFKTVDGRQKTITSVCKDTDTTGRFRITMEIPEEYRGHKHYTMLHVHNGETVTLADLDDDPNTVTFEVDAFSTFALTGSDEILVPVTGAEVWDAELKGSYTTLEEALSHSVDGQYIKLTADAEVNLTLDRDLYIDLDGYTLTGVIVTNGYKIYGMDGTTNGYTCEDIGFLNCTDGSGNPAVPEKHIKTDAAMTGSILRYLAIQTEEGYSFHRFYLGITHQSLKPTTTGVGYKAVFYGDDMVAAKLDSFGFTMTLGNFSPKTVSKSAESFVSGKTVTLRIDNYDVEKYGETALYASVMVKLSDGTVIQSTECSMTLRGMLETVNGNYQSYDETQLALIAEMIKKYAIIQSWKVENLV